MKIDESVALVTGANRGLGRAFARELVARGATKVYGAARNPAAVTEPGVQPIALDITDPERVAQVAAQCADVSLLVNNAGVLKYSTFINAPNLDAARLEMETNYFGTLSMCRAFAPILAANGGGAIVNMLSVTSFYTNPLDASYGASKAAAWSLTNGVRLELHPQGTLVVAVHASFIDIDMAALTNAPKDTPNRSPGRSSTPSKPAGSGARRRANPHRQGGTVTRSRADLPAHPGVLGRRREGHPVSAGKTRPLRTQGGVMTLAPSTGGRSKSLILTAMIFAVAMTFIDQTIVSIAAPTIQHDLGLSSSGMQWAINAYLLTLAALFAFGGGWPTRTGTARWWCSA